MARRRTHKCGLRLGRACPTAWRLAVLQVAPVPQGADRFAAAPGDGAYWISARGSGTAGGNRTMAATARRLRRATAAATVFAAVLLAVSGCGAARHAANLVGGREHSYVQSSESMEPTLRPGQRFDTRVVASGSYTPHR